MLQCLQIFDRVSVCITFYLQAFPSVHVVTPSMVLDVRLSTRGQQERSASWVSLMWSRVHTPYLANHMGFSYDIVSCHLKIVGSARGCGDPIFGNGVWVFLGLNKINRNTSFDRITYPDDMINRAICQFFHITKVMSFYVNCCFTAYFQVVKALLVISRKNSWAEVVHCKLISMLANMFYQLPEEADETVSSTRLFVVEQVDLIGGIEFIFVEVCYQFILKLKSKVRYSSYWIRSISLRSPANHNIIIIFVSKKFVYHWRGQTTLQ